MFLKKKINFYETIYDGAVDIKETFLDSFIDLKNRIVGFAKQVKNHVSDLFDAMPSRTNFLSVVVFSKTV